MINEELFKVENKLQERLRNKYRTFKTKVIKSRVGPNKIQIQLGIAEKYLKISDEELKKKFNELCVAFLETCHKYQIPCKPLYILILTDEEINRGLQIKLKNKKDGSLWNIVFIPPVDLNAPYAFWHYTFLHELGHCWISIKYKDLQTEEIFTDLVAILALKRIVPPQSRLFKETIKLRSYTGGEQGKEYFGRDMQKKVLKNPESHLKKILNLMNKKGDLTQ
jgi:hypothetical protein